MRILSFITCLCMILSADAESFVVKKESSGQRVVTLRDEIVESYGEVAKASSRLIQSLGGITEALIARTTDLINGASCAVHNGNVVTLERYKQALDECERVLNETYVYVKDFERSLKIDKKLVSNALKCDTVEHQNIKK